MLCPVTYPDEKADWLPSALSQIVRKTGALSLDFLAELTPAEALSWLKQLDGVGPKVGAAVLNFSRLKMRVMVVDTHVLRVARRYGFVTDKCTAEEASRILMGLAPEAWTADGFLRTALADEAAGPDALHPWLGPLLRRLPRGDLVRAARRAGALQRGAPARQAAISAMTRSDMVADAKIADLRRRIERLEASEGGRRSRPVRACFGVSIGLVVRRCGDRRAPSWRPRLGNAPDRGRRRPILWQAAPSPPFFWPASSRRDPRARCSSFRRHPP